MNRKKTIQENIEAIQTYRQAFKEGKGWKDVGRFEWDTSCYGLLFMGLVWNAYLRKDIKMGLRTEILDFLEVVYQDKSPFETWQDVKNHLVKNERILLGDEREMTRETLENIKNKKIEIGRTPTERLTLTLAQIISFSPVVLVVLRTFLTYAYLYTGFNPDITKQPHIVWEFPGFVLDSINQSFYMYFEQAFIDEKGRSLLRGDYKLLNISWLAEDLLKTLSEIRPLMKVTTGFLQSEFNTLATIDKWRDPSLPMGIATKQKLEIMRMQDWKSIDLTVEEQRTMFTVNNLCYIKSNEEWVFVTIPEYCRAFGVREKYYKDKKHLMGREKEKALNTLFDLATQHYPVIYGIKEGKKNTVLISEEPYYKVVLLERDTEEDISSLPHDIQKIIKILKNPLLSIRIHPYLQQDTKRYKYLIPDYYEKIKQATKGRVTKYEMNFYAWLLAKSQIEIVVNDREKWAVEVLKMSEKEKKHSGRMNKRIKSLYETFRKAGFLTSYKWSVRSSTNKEIDTLYLNSEKFPSLRQQKLELKQSKH